MQPANDNAFMPPPEPGAGRGFAAAVMAHLLLLGALTWGINWDKESSPAAVEAELWASVPEQAAPAAAPAPPPPVVAPPVVQPPPPPPPPPPAPPVVQPPPPPVARQPDIALERERELQRKRDEEQRAQRLLEERKKLEAKRKQEEEEAERAERRQREEQLKLAKAKALEQAREKEKARELEQARLEQAKREQAKLEQAKREQAAKKREEEAKQLEAARQENLKRMLAAAGSGTGAPSSGGTAARTRGPSGTYAGRIAARIKPNIVFTDVVSGNPAAVVHLRVAPDGTIVSSKLVKSSGLKSWDDAVLRAVERTESIPRDTDGSVVPEFDIEFRPTS